MRIIDYELIEDLSILFESKIILYGAGNWAETVYNFLKETELYPEIICQTEITKKRFHEWNISLLSDVLENCDNDKYLMIIASVDCYEQMIKLCENACDLRICTLFGFFTSIRLHVNEHILSVKLREKIEAEKYVSQYNLAQKLKVYSINQLVKAALAPEDYIWIFQPGKVGSQSIWNSIQNKSLQFHTIMTSFRFTDVEKKYLEYYLELLHNKKIKVIAAVREPISRDIAAFFQNSDLEIFPFNRFNDNIFWLYGDIKNQEMNLNVLDIKKRCPQWNGTLNQSFRDLTYSIMTYKSDLFSWFDYEINQVFGIDVYSYPFDQKKGYTIIEKNNIQLLVLKMEFLNTLESVIGEFIGDGCYKLINRNKASDKIYRYAYEAFKEKLTIPYEYFNYYYRNNPKYKHFYSQEEIKKSYTKWKKYVKNN